MSPYKINKRLNLVIPLYYGETVIYIHAAPISQAVFETNYRFIARVFSDLHQQGMHAFAGPRIAYLELKRIAEEWDRWDGPDGIRNTLVAEIIRLANVILPSDKGWQMTPLQEAIDKKQLDPSDASEVLNALVFFTAGSWMYPRHDLKYLDQIAAMWGGQTESSGCTEFMNSLPTSIEIGNSGEKKKPAVSSVPS